MAPVFLVMKQYSPPIEKLNCVLVRNKQRSFLVHEIKSEELASGQYPFAALVCCSDSRVPPEIVFDCGLGDLFITRVAGNIISGEILGSLEYAAEHLDVNLIVVLGHKRCGAIQATVNGGSVHGNIGYLIRSILPAITKTKNEKGDPVDNAVRENVRLNVESIKKVNEPIVQGYDISTLVTNFSSEDDRNNGNITT